MNRKKFALSIRITIWYKCFFSLTSLPEALGKCTSLRSLDVSYNLLKSLPSSVLALPRLIHLEIDEDVQLPSGYEQTHVVFRIPRDAIFDRRFPNESLAEYRKKLTDIAS